MTLSDFLLLPRPRNVTIQDGFFVLPRQGSILIRTMDSDTLLFTAHKLQDVLTNKIGISYDIRAAGEGTIVFNVVPGSVQDNQGYELKISNEGVFAVANTPQGCFYAVQTLIQIIEQKGRDLPQIRCSDWPDYPNRGVMFDISRDRVPTMDTLYQLVDMLASWKINQLQLYTEHTFAYQKHKTIWENASPMTGEEILDLDAYCRERFVELVPNQNTFGHMQRWLKHEAYIHLAETPDGAQTSSGYFIPEPFSISPVLPESLDLVRDMLDELLPHFTSCQANVGCDETFDVGQGKSKILAKEIGTDRVYLEFLLKIYREVKAHGKVMQFWGDIIMEHPHLVSEVPLDTIALEWGYDAEHPFDEHGELFAASGIPFYVCPGTSSWRTVGGRTDNAIENLRSAAENGLKHGAVGYLITDWGDDGHWQPLPVSYLGYAYGAAVSWVYESNYELSIQDSLDRFIFKDSSDLMGTFVYDLGNIYQSPGLIVPNSSILFQILQSTPKEILNHRVESIKMIESLNHTKKLLEGLLDTLEKVDMQFPQSGLVKREFSWVGKFLIHACLRWIWVLETERGLDHPDQRQQLITDIDFLIAEYNWLWHARSRHGGYSESVARMQKIRTEYVKTRSI